MENYNHEKTELKIFTQNSRDIFCKFLEPLENQILKHAQKNRFDYDKALKGYERVLYYSANLYCKWYGGCVRNCFPKVMRLELAEEMLLNYIDDVLKFECPNYNFVSFAEVVPPAEVKNQSSKIA